MAREIGLSSPDPVESMLEPGRVHNAYFTIFRLTSIPIMISS